MSEEGASLEPRDTPGSQADVLAFFSSGAAFGAGARDVAHRETHGAHVFLCGDDAYKVKREAVFAYMDLSTPERRRQMIEREYAINRRHAPDLYLGIAAVTRAGDGALSLDGPGTPVEWVLHMRRFDEDDLLSRIASRGALDAQLAKALATAVVRSHSEAPVRQCEKGAERFAAVVRDVARQLRECVDVFGEAALKAFEAAQAAQLGRVRDLLDRRGKAGFVRHCHGDLHLNNIVLWHEQPLPFDALEFDDELATIDTFYDLAFLLMDLDRAGLKAQAGMVLDRYLWLRGSDDDLDALATLPLFLGARSAVRAMVSAQGGRLVAEDERQSRAADARDYLTHARSYLQPPPPRLVAIGGVSGTGKSTLAAMLAPDLLPAPAALHVRSDLERKAMFGVGELERLPADNYTPESAAAVYARLLAKTRCALAAGHSVVADAVFLRAHERDGLERLARDLGVRFQGLWLTVPAEVAMARVAARRGDASDATAAVVARQIASMERGAWTTLDAGGSAEATAGKARAALA